MRYRIHGIKAVVVVVLILAAAFALAILALKVLLWLLPAIILVIVVRYLIKVLNKLKKERPGKVLNAKYKVKK